MPNYFTKNGKTLDPIKKIYIEEYFAKENGKVYLYSNINHTGWEKILTSYKEIPYHIYNEFRDKEAGNNRKRKLSGDDSSLLPTVPMLIE